MKKTLSLLLVFVLLLGLGGAAMADAGFSVTDGTAVSKFGDVSGCDVGVEASGQGSMAVLLGGVSEVNTGILAEDGGFAAVSRDIQADSVGIVAKDGSRVTARSVDSAGGGVIAESGSTVTIAEDVKVSDLFHSAINASGENTNVTVAGDVSAAGFAVDAAEGAVVEVFGDVSGTYAGVCTDGVATVSVCGNVTSSDGTGVNTVGNSTVTVGGDVFGGSEGVFLWGIAPISGDRGLLSIGGNLSCGEGGSAFTLVIPETVGPDDLASVVPELVLGSMSPDATVLVYTDQSVSEETKAAVGEALLQEIRYRVDTGGLDAEKVSVDGCEKKNIAGEDVLCAAENTSFTLRPESGGVLINVGGGDARVLRNLDGSYTVTAQRGGNVKLSAVYVEIPAWMCAADSGAETPAPVSRGEEANVLVVDLTAHDSTVFHISTLRRFRSEGVDTVLLRVKDGAFQIAMEELLSLAESGETVGFSRDGEEIAVLVDYERVTALSKS